jgi:short-subunit dehydrogenase involved in D-alanine esterification of teichoic acids
MSLTSVMLSSSTTTSLETIPYPMVFGYSASKAAIRSYILSAREQLKDVGGPKIDIIELYTPIVQSESDQKFSNPPIIPHALKFLSLKPNCTTSNLDGDLAGKLACP